MSVGLAMIGLSHSHSRGNARAAAMVDDVSLLGVWDVDRDLADRRCREWADFQHDLETFASAETALARDDIQGVIVDGAVHENLWLARLALEQGKHVLLEKPAGLDLGEFQRVHELARRRGLLVQMGYIMRYNAGFQLIQRLLASGALGEVFSIRGRISWERASYDALMPEAGARPGGMLLELGCHYLDMIIMLLGRPANYHAHLSCHHDADDRYTDNTVGFLEYERAFAFIESAAMESGALQNRAFEVYGTTGTVVLQPLEPPEVVLHLDEPWEEFRRGWQSARIETSPRHVADLREFAACIQGQKAPDSSPEHDLLVQETLLGMCGI